MKFVEVGGARLSAIGLGTWQFGSTEWGYGKDYAIGEAGAIVKRALELGVNLIDTAEIYGIGRSERIVGEAIRGHRDKVFLATKLFPIGLPFQVQGRARASAKRLGVDHLDLYQLHWPGPFFPPGSTMPRMKRLLDSGLVGHHRGEQPQPRPVAGGRARSRRAGPVEPGAVQLDRASAGARAPALGSARGEADHRVQPVGPGIAVGQVPEVAASKLQARTARVQR